MEGQTPDMLEGLDVLDQGIGSKGWPPLERRGQGLNRRFSNFQGPGGSGCLGFVRIERGRQCVGSLGG